MGNYSAELLLQVGMVPIPWEDFTTGTICIVVKVCFAEAQIPVHLIYHATTCVRASYFARSFWTEFHITDVVTALLLYLASRY
jgi:hypothetical protein